MCFLFLFFERVSIAVYIIRVTILLVPAVTALAIPLTNVGLLTAMKGAVQIFFWTS